MRILLVADIHSNWPALQAVQEAHDVCLFLGDAVDYGLDPGPCIEWLRTKATYAVRGNHDHGVAQFVTVQGKAGYRYLTTVTRAITQEKISAADRRYLGTLPITRHLTLDNTNFLLVHATPRDPLDEYAQPDLDFWTQRLKNVQGTVVCVGHTHNPYVLEVGDNLVVNPGSVGQPRDGDPRASYAVIDDHRVELKRIEYPIQDTIREFMESSLPDPAKSLLTEIISAGGIAKNGTNKQPHQPEA